jgi:hypothetical protein
VVDIAFIQEKGNGRLAHENALVHEHCVRIGLPVELFTPKRMLRRQLPLNHRSFVFGDVDITHSAMRQLKIAIPETSCYPDALAPYLRRRVWKDTLGAVRQRLDDGAAPVFAKPASRLKVFTGGVFSHHSDFYSVGSTSWKEPVWCSEVVEWRSECRVYVIGTEIVSVDHYDGDATVRPDLGVIEEAVNDYSRSGEAPAAYGIDFGVLASGETALIEANEGYSLGAYQISSEAYTNVVFARWRQLTASIPAE